MRVQIFGERCSGTNYLEELLLLNFDVEITWTYGWKHFFGFNEFTNSDDVLFIGIIRNLNDWINSFYRNPYHLPPHITKSVQSFLTEPFYSVNKQGEEMMEDRNLETKERYKNIFELRHVKNKFLMEKMPTLVKNYCLITHEDLLNRFENTMYKLKMYLRPKEGFPSNISYYKKNKKVAYTKKPNIIPDELIRKHVKLFYEVKL